MPLTLTQQLLVTAQALVDLVKSPQLEAFEAYQRSKRKVKRSSYYSKHADAQNLRTKERRDSLKSQGRCIICTRLKEPTAGTRCFRCANKRNKKVIRTQVPIPAPLETKRTGGRLTRNPVGTVKFIRNGSQVQAWLKTVDTRNGKSGWTYWMPADQARLLGVSDGQILPVDKIMGLQLPTAEAQPSDKPSVAYIPGDSDFGRSLQREFGKNWRQRYSSSLARITT